MTMSYIADAQVSNMLQGAGRIEGGALRETLRPRIGVSNAATGSRTLKMIILTVDDLCRECRRSRSGGGGRERREGIGKEEKALRGIVGGESGAHANPIGH